MAYKFLSPTMLAFTLLSCSVANEMPQTNSRTNERSGAVAGATEIKPASGDAASALPGVAGATVTPEESRETPSPAPLASSSPSPAPSASPSASPTPTPTPDPCADSQNDPTGMSKIFVITGQDQRRMISTDALTWTNNVYIAPNGFDDAYGSVVIGNGTIVAAGDSGVITSLDGISWITPSPPAANQGSWGSLHGSVSTYRDGHFTLIAGGNVYTSPDGIVWSVTAIDTSVVSPGGFVAFNHWASLAAGCKFYAAVGDAYDYGKSIYVNTYLTSPDGVTWTVSYGTQRLRLAFGEKMFVATAPGGYYATSHDGGITWDHTGTLVDANFGTGDSDMAYGNGHFRLCNQVCYDSTDGLNWTKTGGYSSGVWADGLWFNAAFWADVNISRDMGNSWTKVYSDNSPNMFASGQMAPFFTSSCFGYIKPSKKTP